MGQMSSAGQVSTIREMVENLCVEAFALDRGVEDDSQLDEDSKYKNKLKKLKYQGNLR